MARMVAHGGFCCGMRHISGMSLNTDQTAARLENDIAYSIHAEGGGRLFEVVLNERQMREQPVLDLLRKYGFTLVSSFNNRTGARCAIFHRADSRVPLSYWRNQWGGMTIAPDLQGNLPRIPGTLNLVHPGLTQEERQRQHRLTETGRDARVGDQVRVVNSASDYFGMEGRVTSSTNEFLNIRFTNGERRGQGSARISQRSVRIIQRANQAGQPQVREPVIPAQAPWAFPVHENAGNLPPAPTERVVVPPVRSLFTLYYNVLRAGRSEAGWPTFAAARAAAPRAQSIDAQVFFSDGTTSWTRAVPANFGAQPVAAEEADDEDDGYEAED